MNDESQEITFVDTNILVYAFDRSAGAKHQRAAQIIGRCWETQSGCLSLQVLQEFYVSVTRKIPNPLDIQTARNLVSDLAHWRVHSPDASDLLEAIDLQQRWQLSFWDAMIVQSAQKSGCRQLLSEDLSHQQMFGNVQVINPFL
jgi:predicted nucleic acid-binding protein